ncbi:carbamate kinase [Nakamurella sp. UYEF19]|uniref:carbamate kinase n=1 Tax=Nakamurella sp. UYEF19 TaxID=1756392 RepID=UPI003395A644
MRIVVALGGNALLRRGEKPDAAIQLDHIHAAAASLAPLTSEHDLLICHGNGPQVGMLALESENDRELTHSYPLDALVAQTQGMIGYWLVQSLANAGVRKPLLGMVTQTVVDPADPAFAHPTKFIGPGYPEKRAEELAARHGWQIAADGAAWRRVVASPAPQRIVEQELITQLLDRQVILVCAGGAGIPVTENAGVLVGVDAVIDKDLTAAMLAIAVGADRLIILTDVTAIMSHFGTPEATTLNRLDLDQLAQLSFPAGSMGPKVTACRQFVEATGHPAAIGALTDAADILTGAAGTTITAGRERP